MDRCLGTREPAGTSLRSAIPLLLFAQLLVLCTGCISTRRAGRLVQERLQEAPAPTPVAKSDYLDVRSRELVWLDTLSRTRTMRSWCVPAIFYWGWGKTITCDLNPSIPLGILTEEFMHYADSIGLQGRLQGARLELTIERMPSRFIYQSDMTSVFLVFAYATTSSETLRPDGEDLVVGWSTHRDGRVLKSGTITIPDRDPGAGNVFRSTRYFLRAYVDLYKGHVRYLGGRMMDQLMLEL
jgi:hypothetical protein